MSSRVTVNITARDLTRPELQRMRRNFHHLGQDLDRMIGQRTRENFDRLRESLNSTGRDLRRLRGAIPDAEFDRLDTMMRRAQSTMRRGFGNMNSQDFTDVQRRIREIEQSFRRINAGDGIRVRVDNSALRRADAQLAAWRRQQSQNGVRVRVDPEVRGNILTRSLRRALAAPLRSLGDTMSDGIGQAFARGFYAAANNPYVAAAVLALVATIISWIGAALAGGLTLVFGGVVVGLGGFIAAQSKKVKDAFSKELNALKPLFREAAEPMIPVLLHGIDLMGQMGRKFAPAFERALEESAPYLTEFMDHIAQGMEKFGEIAGEPMMKAFNDLLTTFGPQLEDWFVSLGEAFEHLGEVVSENKEEIALALRFLLELLPLAIHLVAWLAEQFANVVRQIEWVVEKLAQLWLWITKAWKISLIVSAPHLATIQRNVTNLWGWLMRPWVRQIRFSAPSLVSITRNVQNLWSWVQRNWARQVRFSAPGIARIIGWVKQLWGWVNRSWFKNVVFNFSTTGSIGTIQKLLGFAKGGVVGAAANISAAATGGNRGNRVLVGERGPEIVDLPGGSHVRSNSDSRREFRRETDLLPPTIRIEASHDDASQFVLRLLRKSIRIEGGNVQFVLGQSGI